ncbi:exosome complex exonuclease DIS3/RRP44 [Rhizoctonia solani]|uniref:Exosome complex exonuclease DIS3/RRP44 n=1 Tax=Rhizoctonia solani TaxID=456999 RepID=A0A8H8P6W2_9AGAM|nr:exosome complex exonuclease DIS3/RRP44 [Rhizoctonia solani]QRW26270.1 exosome complex exonuclease DIS3/RRP44 [Rhizoctonia solani]
MSFTRRYYSTDRPPVSERNRPYVQLCRDYRLERGHRSPRLFSPLGAVGAGDKVAELVPAEWIQEGEQWAGRVGRRYGLFGFEKTDKGKDDPPAEVAIVGDVANAVLAPNQDARVAAISVATKLDGSDVQALDVTSPYVMIDISYAIHKFQGQTFHSFLYSMHLFVPWSNLPLEFVHSPVSRIKSVQLGLGSVDNIRTPSTTLVDRILLIYFSVTHPAFYHLLHLPRSVGLERDTPILPDSDSPPFLLSQSQPINTPAHTPLLDSLPFPNPRQRAGVGEEDRVGLTRDDLWPYIRMIDIEMFARGSSSLGTKLATFISSLAHLDSFALRLPTFRVFRDALTSDLRSAFSSCLPMRGIKTLCVDAHSAWMVPLFPGATELVVWCWPKPGTCEDEERTDGWKMVFWEECVADHRHLDPYGRNCDSEETVGGWPVFPEKVLQKDSEGKVLKVLRERYVRDDIQCGIESVNYYNFTEAHKSPLAPAGDLTHTQFPNGHFIIPDTNVILHQMDLVESPLFNPPIILLQTVIDEVRHRSLPLHSRLKGLIASEDKQIYVFYNEFHVQTAVVRQRDETPNDRNDRGIRVSASWYAKHYAAAWGQQASSPEIVLLTDDAENRRRASKEGTRTLSVREYVTGTKNSAALLDLLAAESVGGEGDVEMKQGRRKVLYEEYLPQATLVAGVKSGDLHQGYFNANSYNYLEGSVNVPGFPKPVLLLGREAMNRSVQDAVIDADSAQRNDNPDDSASEGEHSDDEDAIQAKERQAARDAAARNPKEKQPTGRVVGVMKRNWRAYVCHIDRSSLSTTSSILSVQTVFATPVDRALPRIRLRTRQAPELLGQKILVSLTDGTLTPDTRTDTLFAHWAKQKVKRPNEREGDQWVVPPKESGRPEWRDREDLRDLIVCSIDPPNCQDIDDALHARQLPNGNIEAGVHIADVSHFVHPDTPMDNEAASRGTTVYLVDKRIDMLPSLLGTNLCSLRPYVERLAFSAIWTLSRSDSQNRHASKAAFTYEEAQIRKDDPTMSDELTQSIRLLNSLALKLKAKRMAAGALNLASPEVKIHLDSAESSDPIDVEQKELRETNSLVEEFMLLANVSVARQIQESFPGTAVLRRHLPPPHSNFEKLQDLLMKLKGMTLDVSSSGALAASLDKCVDPNEPAFNTLVRIMATRCMLSAEYFCAGSVSRETFGHYGLASPIYTHFTSPIRRYADVLAHRQLAASIGYTPLHATLHTKSHVEQVMSVINRRHRMAQMAGRASVEFYVGLALKARNLAQQDNEGVVEEAFVIRAFRNGLAVFVSKLGIEGLVTFKNEQEFDSESYSVTLPGPSGTAKVAVFDRVRVKIRVEQDKNTLRGKVKMALVSPVSSVGL